MPSCSSRHGYLVPEFAERLSAKLKLEFVNAMVKNVGCAEQKDQNNSVTQYDNAYNALEVVRGVRGNILLVDDMIDSGWSFAVAASKLVDAGASGVYGFALANTGYRK